MTHDFGDQYMTAEALRRDAHSVSYLVKLFDASGDLLGGMNYTSSKKGAPEQWDDAQWESLLATVNELRATR